MRRKCPTHLGNTKILYANILSYHPANHSILKQYENYLPIF